jgi:hypothetical protein
MGLKKKEHISGIANLLPEGLDEGTLEKIAELINKKINEEVKSQISDLTLKVQSFIRGNIEKLKEHARKELELQDETFRNAQMFETVRSMMAVELTQKDELNGVTALASIGESQEKKLELLVVEVDKLLKENARLKNATKLSIGENVKLKESLEKMQNTANLKEASKTKHMSDSAIVVSEQNFKVKDSTKEQKTAVTSRKNEWLTESVLEANKKLNGKQ